MSAISRSSCPVRNHRSPEAKPTQIGDSVTEIRQAPDTVRRLLRPCREGIGRTERG